MPSHTNAQREKIREIVLELWTLKIRSADAICHYLSEKEHISLSQRQVERYISEVKTELVARSKVNREQMIGTALERLEKLYAICIKEEKYQTALAVQKEISETFGLKAPSSVDLGVGQTLEDWLNNASKTWPAEGIHNAGGSDSGPDPKTISKQNH